MSWFFLKLVCSAKPPLTIKFTNTVLDIADFTAGSSLLRSIQCFGFYPSRLHCSFILFNSVPCFLAFTVSFNWTLLLSLQCLALVWCTLKKNIRDFVNEMKYANLEQIRRSTLDRFESVKEETFTLKLHFCRQHCSWIVLFILLAMATAFKHKVNVMNYWFWQVNFPQFFNT